MGGEIAREQGISMREHNQTQGNQTEFTGSLLEAVRSQSLPGAGPARAGPECSDGRDGPWRSISQGEGQQED